MPKVLRAAADIPDWYPLDAYDKEMSAVEWHEALFQRLMLQAALKTTDDVQRVRGLFVDVLVERKGLNYDFFENVPSAGELWGVASLTGYELAYLAAMMLASDDGKALVERVQAAREEKDAESLFMHKDPVLDEAKKQEFGDFVDWDKEPFDMSDVVPRFPSSIDLDQDDETLKLSFEVFLAGVRDSLGPAKRAFDYRDFGDWRRYGVLQVFDLQLWARLSDSRYTDSLLARTIWPDEDVDVTERMRKVARPKVRMLFDDWSVVSRLHRQIELEKSLERLVEERNQKGSK